MAFKCLQHYIGAWVLGAMLEVSPDVIHNGL